MTNNAAASRANVVPKEIQSTTQERLSLLRKSRGLQLNQIPGISAGTVTKYELHDMSTMKMADVYLFANAYGLSMTDLLAYLFEEADVLSDQSANAKRMSRLVSMLDEDDAALACEIVDQLVSAKRSKKIGF